MAANKRLLILQVFVTEEKDLFNFSFGGGGVKGIRIKPAGKDNSAFRPSHICLLIGG